MVGVVVFLVKTSFVGLVIVFVCLLAAGGVLILEAWLGDKGCIRYDPADNPIDPNNIAERLKRYIKYIAVLPAITVVVCWIVVLIWAGVKNLPNFVSWYTG